MAMELDPNRWIDRLPPRARQPVRIAWLAASRWTSDGGPALGASIAFYTMFALAPLLVVAIAIVGAVFGPDAARGDIVAQIQGLVGETAARSIEAMIEAAWREPDGTFATVLAVVTLLVGASGVFAQMRLALNAIGHVTPRPSAIGAFLRARLIAFALVLGFGFLAIASLLASAVLAGVGTYLSRVYPILTQLLTLGNVLVPVAVLTVAFAALLRWLPDSPPSRRGLWTGAIGSSLMFEVGKHLIGLYLGRASVSSSYGAAGSFVVLMLWVYYSAQILLYGAALGRAYDEVTGQGPQRVHGIDPAPGMAVPKLRATLARAVSRAGALPGDLRQSLPSARRKEDRSSPSGPKAGR